MSDGRPTTVDQQVRTVLNDFLLELYDRLSAHEIERVLSGDKDDLTSFDVGQKPETFTEDYLIHPLLGAVGIEYERQPYAQKGNRVSWPDFETQNLDETVIGENKPLNNVEEAKEEIKGYIDRISVNGEYGIITDGIEWRLYAVERGGDRPDFAEIASVNFRDALQTLARDADIIASQGLDDANISGVLSEFVDLFEPDAFNEFISVEVPQKLRDLRQQDIEEFYGLYIELLFGESDEYDYETYLMEDIEAPPEATGSDNRRFAVTLMNRLIFIKNLENKGVVSDGLLLNRLEAYEENESAFMQGFYEAQLKPLFYDLFNQPRNERPPRLRTGWAGEVPYLNGGLFRKNVENERDYTVRGRVLPEVIRELIEAGGLDMRGDSLDPAILGSVFEKTINFIGGEFGTQKDVGAYYTPDDVTQLITEQTVDPKLHDLLADTWTEHVETDTEGAQEEVREYLEHELSLSDFLEKVEDGRETTFRYEGSFIEINFGDEDIIKTAIDRLNNLSIVDPACGSGHFLTTVMEQAHRVRKALERGRNDGETPPAEENYEAKKQLALNAIYGVDIDPVAVEIARLRVWLKIIENGWQEEFGRLPNIELNIISGNSLVGLPVQQTGTTRLSQYDDRLEELVELRREYKQEDSISKQEVLERRNEVRKDLNEEFIERLNYTTETEVSSVDEWDNVVDGAGGGLLYPEIESVKIKRGDRGSLTDTDKKRLEKIGFRPHTKSARLDIESRHNELRDEGSASSHVDARKIIVDNLRTLLQDDFEFVEVKRQPLLTDLEDVQGTPVHWMAEFPEVVPEDDTDSVDFDIVIGNPPYGTILSDKEKLFLEWYRTGRMNEIAGPFVERQLQLLGKQGWFGNIHAQGLLYKKTAAPARDTLRGSLSSGRLASFGHRPSTVFAGANPRAAITTGQKAKSPSESEFKTSGLILFYPEGREQSFNHIEYGAIDGLVLGGYIGDEETNAAYPKIGSDMSRTVLETLRNNSETKMGDASTRNEETTEYPVYRSYHPLYWMNPFLEDLYTQHPSDDISPSRDFKPMYFESELQRRAAFLTLQSSTFYHYWTTYENQRDLNWGPIEAFPFPSKESLEPIREEIIELSDRMWEEMKKRFNGRGIENGADLKPLADRADDLLAPLLGLDDDQIAWVKDYHTEFGRANEDRVLTDWKTD